MSVPWFPSLPFCFLCWLVYGGTVCLNTSTHWGSFSFRENHLATVPTRLLYLQNYNDVLYDHTRVWSYQGYVTNPRNDHLPVGLFTQLVEHCTITCIVEIMGLTPIKLWMVMFILQYRAQQIVSVVLWLHFFLKGT